MEWINIIQTLGFPIACVVACGFFIYKLVNRDKDEAKERENRLLDSNLKSAEALEKVSDTIKETNEINKSLMDKLDNKIDKLDGDVNKILDKLDGTH